MEQFADYLIWGAVAIIIIRIALKPILSFLGITVEKRDKNNP